MTKKNHPFSADFYGMAAGEQNIDDNMRKRIEGSISAIPDDVTNILDLGCGSGEVTNLLVDKYDITGVDFSINRLRNVLTKRVAGSIDQVPFRDKSFDLVLCVSVLEHLTDELLQSAIKEISRLSRKYVRITVPNCEDLTLKNTRCEKCCTIFHANGHFQSFSPEKIAKILPGYDIVSVKAVSPIMTREYCHVLLKLRQRLVNSWFYTDSLYCPNCKNTEFHEPSYIVSRMFSGLNAILNPKRKLKNRFLVAQFKKQSSV